MQEPCLRETRQDFVQAMRNEIGTSSNGTTINYLSSMSFVDKEYKSLLAALGGKIGNIATKPLIGSRGNHDEHSVAQYARS